MKHTNWEPYESDRQYWQELSHWGALLCRAAEGDEPLRREAEACWSCLEGRAAAGAEAGVFFPLPYLAAALGLSGLQTKLLALALLLEADGSFEKRLAALGRKELTVGLALRLVGGSDLPGPGLRAALAPGGALAQYGLEEYGEPGATGLSCCFRAQRRVVEFALTEAWEDPGTPGLTLLPPKEDAPLRLRALYGRMEAYLAQAGEERTSFLLQGQPGSGRRTLARALAGQRGAPLLLADGAFLAGAEGSAFRRSLVREALIQQCPVCLTGLDETVRAARTDRQAADYLTELLYDAAAAGCSFLRSEEEWSPVGGPELWRAVPVPLPVPGLEESRGLWREFLRDCPLAGEQKADELAGKYRLTPGQMKQAIETACTLARWQGLEGVDGDCLDRGCRSQLRHALGDRARKVEAVFAWEDLILPENSKRLLRSACDQMRYRRQVYGAWGFGRKLAYGAGLSMLFSGPPGTGKTMAAQIAAGELGLELYKVDLAAVVSKYVGETEKNLNEIFREASRSQAVLFFDEADVLFGKRTEMKDAHDKYNNMEAAYLLQKMEEYTGVSILATNFLQNFDEAFKRRLKFIIEFPLPGVEARRLLWRAVFPVQTPLEAEIDWEFLAAQFELSGSSIKNAAVNAAFLAAGDGRAVGMGHVLTALRRELFKSGKILTREDFGQYYMLAEEGEHGRL